MIINERVSGGFDLKKTGVSYYDDMILYPMSTFERMIRYINYGYNPCKETKLKIAGSINKLSENEVLVSNNLYNGVD